MTPAERRRQRQDPLPPLPMRPDPPHGRHPMTRDRTAYIEAGAKAARAVTWHREPCPAELVVVADDQAIGRTFACQRPQKWAGDRYPGHRLHIWRGEIDGCRAELNWQAEL